MECVRCPWLLAEMKVATILGILVTIPPNLLRLVTVRMTQKMTEAAEANGLQKIVAEV